MKINGVIGNIVVQCICGKAAASSPLRRINSWRLRLPFTFVSEPLPLLTGSAVRNRDSSPVISLMYPQSADNDALCRGTACRPLFRRASGPQG